MNREKSVSDLVEGSSWAARETWDEIVRRFGRLVLHTARRVGLSQSDAADVAQLTWLRLIEHADQIRDPDQLPAWLVSTARREGVRLATGLRRCVPCDDLAARFGQTAVYDAYPAEGDYGPLVEQALSRLPAQYQTLLRLLTGRHGYSYLDISQRMAVPIGSIGPMRMRALRMLQNTPELRSLCGGRLAALVP